MIKILKRIFNRQPSERRPILRLVYRKGDRLIMATEDKHSLNMHDLYRYAAENDHAVSVVRGTRVTTSLNDDVKIEKHNASVYAIAHMKDAGKWLTGQG